MKRGTEGMRSIKSSETQKSDPTRSYMYKIQLGTRDSLSSIGFVSIKLTKIHKFKGSAFNWFVHAINTCRVEPKRKDERAKTGWGCWISRPGLECRILWLSQTAWELAKHLPFCLVIFDRGLICNLDIGNQVLSRELKMTSPTRQVSICCLFPDSCWL